MAISWPRPNRQPASLVDRPRNFSYRAGDTSANADALTNSVNTAVCFLLRRSSNHASRPFPDMESVGMTPTIRRNSKASRSLAGFSSPTSRLNCWPSSLTTFRTSNRDSGVSLGEIDDLSPVCLQRLDVGFLMLKAALEQDLEQRIVPFRLPALASGCRHLERGAMPTTQEVRKICGRQD